MTAKNRISALEKAADKARDKLIVIEREGVKSINGEAITREQYARLVDDYQVVLIQVNRCNVKQGAEIMQAIESELESV
ncbi:MAG: hypothetical protein DRO87_11265 [Candidatus Thorarchaeota archaeon]|nr:MAG: hypothetical protein DRO87_11265 [Candidatus Thorarchaeota archaeon]